MEVEELGAKLMAMVNEVKLDVHAKKLETQTQIEAIWAEINMTTNNATPNEASGGSIA
jgi:hypothetical protein